MKDTEPNVAVQSSKQKFSLKDALFGGGAGTSGTDYKIIYFGIAVCATNNGPEQFLNVIYGDGMSIYTNMLPLMSVMFSYKDDVSAPIIKLNKRIIPGGSKAEILLPRDFSLMGMMSAGLNFQSTPAQDNNVKYQDPYANINNNPEGAFGESEGGSVSQSDEVQRILASGIDTENNNDENDEETPFEPPKSKRNIPDAPDVIEEEEFVATLDENYLTDKIEKFMERHNPEPQKKPKRERKEIDPRPISEVKQETVENEVDKIIKNAENIRRTAFADANLSPEIVDVRDTSGSQPDTQKKD